MALEFINTMGIIILYLWALYRQQTWEQDPIFLCAAPIAGLCGPIP